MRRVAVCLAVVAVASLATTAMAISYASGLKGLGGGNFSFVLNEGASNVIIDRFGDTTLNLGALPKGTHTFNLGTGLRFGINVSSNKPAGWHQISTDQTSTSFYVPLGVSVNKNPMGLNFGTVYVSNAQGGTTAFGRATSDGIYTLNADASEIAFATGGKDWAAAGNNSPKNSTIGADDHLYVADFSNDLAWEFSADMSSVTQLVDGTNKTASQFVESLYVEGTQAAGNRNIYLVDSNYYAGAPGRKGLIQYTLGGNPKATGGDTGVQYIGPGTPTGYFAFYPRDVARDSNGDWYMNQYRSNPAQAPAISKFLDAAPPINTAAWETPMAAPYNGAYGIDVSDRMGWVAYGNYYDGFVRIFDTTTGAYVDGFDAGNRLREVAFDAAGNIYTVDNSTEWLRIWSPGGRWIATTTSCGTFDLVPEPTTLALLAFGGLGLIRRRRA